MKWTKEKIDEVMERLFGPEGKPRDYILMSSKQREIWASLLGVESKKEESTS